MFTGVFAARHAEAKLKIEALEQLLSEIMSLNHPEVFYRLVSNRELHTAVTKADKQAKMKEAEEASL